MAAFVAVVTRRYEHPGLYEAATKSFEHGSTREAFHILPSGAPTRYRALVPPESAYALLLATKQGTKGSVTAPR